MFYSSKLLCAFCSAPPSVKYFSVVIHHSNFNSPTLPFALWSLEHLRAPCNLPPRKSILAAPLNFIMQYINYHSPTSYYSCLMLPGSFKLSILSRPHQFKTTSVVLYIFSFLCHLNHLRLYPASVLWGTPPPPSTFNTAMLSCFIYPHYQV